MSDDPVSVSVNSIEVRKNKHPISNWNIYNSINAL